MSNVPVLLRMIDRMIDAVEKDSLEFQMKKVAQLRILRERLQEGRDADEFHLLLSAEPELATSGARASIERAFALLEAERNHFREIRRTRDLTDAEKGYLREVVIPLMKEILAFLTSGDDEKKEKGERNRSDCM